MNIPPLGLGYPSGTAISNYYPGAHVTMEEITNVSKALDKAGIEHENTRIRKQIYASKNTFEVLQASAQASKIEITSGNESASSVCLVRGDHAREMAEICTQ